VRLFGLFGEFNGVISEFDFELVPEILGSFEPPLPSQRELNPALLNGF
jgi:hypothetical protein